ncbi:MAG: MFS transporter [Deltaproteobacteria bacterium]|nr:MFS transporter [Deltaproteobacteria bacterium]
MHLRGDSEAHNSTAIGGVLVAEIGAGYAFLINSASFVGVTAVVFAWHRATEHSTLPAERLVGALKAGIRYTRYSPRLTAILLRTGLFTLGGSAMPGLLPLIARYQLRIGATAYGELLGLFGVGGVIGGALVPPVGRLYWVTGRASDVSIHGPGWHCLGRPDVGCRRVAKQHFDDAEIAALFMVFSLSAALRYRLPESERFALEPAELIPTR